ncbi:hypothetical protein BGX38DRAFT_1146770 [Terfezia claveryi]|nr:hypothetical protein BGX38DRAFT_1146770 [Terfezia claveryi]
MSIDSKITFLPILSLPVRDQIRKLVTFLYTYMKTFFPEEDPNFNLYAPFRDSVDYRLARFFNSAKTSKGKIEQFFRDGILKSLNPTHKVQFHSAYTMYKLVDAAANEPRWRSGMRHHPEYDKQGN